MILDIDTEMQNGSISAISPGHPNSDLFHTSPCEGVFGCFTSLFWGVFTKPLKFKSPSWLATFPVLCARPGRQLCAGERSAFQKILKLSLLHGHVDLCKADTFPEHSELSLWGLGHSEPPRCQEHPLPHSHCFDGSSFTVSCWSPTQIP